jgi:hypothetical protein
VGAVSADDAQHHHGVVPHGLAGLTLILSVAALYYVVAYRRLGSQGGPEGS